jgi:hypothetical protein
MMRSNVDLPQPDAPTSAMNSPAAMLNEMSASAVNEPAAVANCLLMP